MALVIVLNEAGVFPAKLGGITGPGSRPKKDRNRAFLLGQSPVLHCGVFR